MADANNTFTYGYQYNQATATDPRVGSTTGTKQDFMPYTLTKGGSPVIETVRTYEARRDALAVIANTAGGTTRSSYTYTVNAIGQRTGLTTSFTLGGGLGGNPGGTNWLYDSLGQLESADAPETEPSADADRYFQYDTIGNRKLSRTDTPTNSAGTLTEYFGLVTSGTPSLPGGNTLNQYAGITKAGSTLEPVHDNDGNATSYPLPAHNSLSTLAWDAENRLTSVTVNGVTTSYRYDALSRRIAKITGSVTTLYRYDGWNCIAEYTGSTTLSEIRTWGLDLSGSGQGAGGVGGLLAEKTGGTYYYPTFDGNGNVSEYLNANGDTIAHFEYDPFGNTVINAGNVGNVGLFNYRFSTKPLDFETGLFYYGYRFYDPVTGRWPSRDPIAERGGMNLYGFIANDGINLVDILGLNDFGPGELTTPCHCPVKFSYSGNFRTRVLDHDSHRVEINANISVSQANRKETGSECECGEIKLLQVIQRFKRDADGTDTPVGDPGADWRTAVTNRDGWRIDWNDPMKVPMPGSTPPWVDSIDGVGKPGAMESPATFNDHPGVERSKEGVRIFTCAVYKMENGDLKMMGCLEWGYYVDQIGWPAYPPKKVQEKAPNPVLLKGTPRVHCGMPPEVKGAIDFWNQVFKKPHTQPWDVPQIPAIKPSY